MIIRADANQVVVIETDTRRVIKMTAKGAWVNERQVDALPHAYTDLVPRTHAAHQIAVDMAQRYLDYSEHREG